MGSLNNDQGLFYLLLILRTQYLDFSAAIALRLNFYILSYLLFLSTRISHYGMGWREGLAFYGK